MSIKSKMRSVMQKILKNGEPRKDAYPVSPELARVMALYKGYDKDHIWAFCAGQVSQDFRGNPKYLFVYVNRYRPDIKAYWFCDSEETLQQVRDLGFEAYGIGTPEAQYVMNRTGVVVAEQVKMAMPEAFGNIKYVNLWHGVGFKSVERRLFDGEIALDLARKYVKRGTFYRDHQLMNASCPVIEEEYTDDCGVDQDKFLRVGYPRCLYQQNFDPIVSFDHDLRKQKGLSADAKLVVYAPTYRAALGGTFSKAMTDFERLYALCEKKNILFIFKVHPHMEKEIGFLKAKEKYGDLPHFLFWDNRNDYYEIAAQTDLVIYDYTSMVSDFVAAGVEHYIRYVFDFEEYQQTVTLHDNYFEKTTGIMCYTFDALLDAIDTYEQRDETAEVAALNERLWSYSQGKDDFERIIQATFDFIVQERKFPTLYSFDIFDTLFTRKVLDPAGIFYAVRERIIQDGGFPVTLREKYPSIRHTAEMNLREYYNKSKVTRDSVKTEITFDEIFARIAKVYDLDAQQVEKLKAWELEAEYDNVVPLPKQIDQVKALLADGEKVVLISDMYLPKEAITKMLIKADPVLGELPLFLSCEYGVLKTSQLLFFEVYKSFEPYYDFKKWIHYGDNPKADEAQPRNFQINTRKVEVPQFGGVQQQLVDFIGTYDAYLVAAMQARLSNECWKDDDLTISFISLCFVPYIDWVLRDAQKRGYEKLYFIARDGHHLKRIADAIIAQRGLNIKTKYIYASRRTWRIPSFVHEVDNDFWQAHGSFGEILSKDKLLSAMSLTEEQFNTFFPYIDLDAIDFYNTKEMNSIKEIFKNTKAYCDYLVDLAAKERVLVSGYLKQEIDPNEKHAFVEYYGRGYTQDCYVRLWRDIVGDDSAEVPYYYYRCICPDMDGCIRHNFTTNDTKPYFIESIFANMPYKSVQEYTLEDGVIKPVIVPIPYNEKLFASMNAILPEFAKRYASLPFMYPNDINHLLIEFMFHYYTKNLTNLNFASQIGTLVDSVTLYGNKRELAPAFTMETLDQLEEGVVTRESMKLTSSITMSVARSTAKVQERYRQMYQIMPGEGFSAGNLLTPGERKTNQKYKTKLQSLEKRADAFAQAYQEAAEACEVQDKVLLLSKSKSIKNTGLDLIRDALVGEDRFTVEEIYLSGIEDDVLAETLASARYILVTEPVELLCKLTFRKETQYILLPLNAFALYNKGPASNYALKWRRRYAMVAKTNDFSAIQIPAQSREDFMRKNYAPKRNVNCRMLGHCLSDRYFDESARESARAAVVRKFPVAKDKKIILYMPTWRVRHDCDQWLRIIDLELLQQFLGEEYVVVVHFKKKEVKKPTPNAIDIPGFSKEISAGISIRNLMIASDVIVGDYRDEFFEAPLMRKPVFSTADDFETYTRVNNMSINGAAFENFLFCPVVANAEALAKELKQLDSYDYTAMDAFRDTILSGCDGHSVERVVAYLNQEPKEDTSWIHPDTVEATFG